jgi:hypothetical protein
VGHATAPGRRRRADEPAKRRQRVAALQEADVEAVRAGGGDVTADREHLGVGERREQLLKPAWLAHAVVIGEGDDRSAGLAHAGVAGGGEAAVLPERDDTGTVLGGDGRGRVARAVVDDERLTASGVDRLLAQRGEDRRQVRRTVVAAHDDTDVESCHLGER